jgi:hypothetical protein
MNHILILIVTLNSGISVTSVRFHSEETCLRAIGKLIDMEKIGSPKIKATCVRE